MADDQIADVTETAEAPETAPAPDTAQAAPDTTQVTELVACQCRSTYHWRHGGGACPNPARWCQWCKDGGCVLARQANAARERHGRKRRRRSRSRSRSSHGGMMAPGFPALPLPPTVPFPMLPPIPPLPCPVPWPGTMGRDVSDASSSSPSSSSSSSSGSSDDGRRDLEKMSLQLFRPPWM